MGLLSRIKIKYFPINYGLIEQPISDKDWMFGASQITQTVLMPAGQWFDYAPDSEIQKGEWFDSMACVTFSLLNSLETLNNVKFKEKWNKSDRFLAKISGTTPRGNSMNDVADSLRNFGIVDEQDWPWDEHKFNRSMFYAPIPVDIVNKAWEWVERYLFEYVAVPLNKSLMMAALQYSPLWVSGYAWAQNKKGLYYSVGNPNHCFVILGYTAGYKWFVFDTYPPYIKELDWNFRFGTVKQVALNKLLNPEIRKLQERGIEFVLLAEQAGEIYHLTDKGIEKVFATLDVQALKEKGSLVGINNDLFAKLIT